MHILNSSTEEFIGSRSHIVDQITTLNLSNSTNESFRKGYEFSPGLFQCFLAIISIIIFFVGIIGNLLVILVVAKNAHMRTITNIFIVNLAIGDFLVVLICLPPTMINDITGNWWFGKMTCKIIPYVQYISVCVSVMTLTAISYERYYAIVYPLKFKATKFRAKIIILFVWILAVFINFPLVIVTTLFEEDDFKYCHPTWDPLFQNIFDSFTFLILYVLPMALIFYTYSKVFKVLWKIDKSIAMDDNDNNTNNSIANSKKVNLEVSSHNNQSIMNSSKQSIANVNNQTQANTVVGNSTAKSKMKNQLIARRKAAKMLISVAMMFGLCYLPIHILNILRFMSQILEYLGDYIQVIFGIAHCLVYVNSSVNPLIYNFMSDNFRKEFRNILLCRFSDGNNNKKILTTITTNNIESNYDSQFKNNAKIGCKTSRNNAIDINLNKINNKFNNLDAKNNKTSKNIQNDLDNECLIKKNNVKKNIL